MRLLLDTHIYLWWLMDSPRLPERARAMIMAASEVYVSSASIWEATIKVGIGKLEADVNALVAAIAQSGFQELPVTASHAATVMQLSELDRDPFDRMLVAQAISEPLRFVTTDAVLKGYSELVEVV